MKREPFCRGPIDDDLGYLWAAYKMGAVPEGYMPVGLEKEEFMRSIVDLLVSFEDVKTMIAPRHGLPTPMGMAIVETRGFRIQPHALWFPWASARNKIECAAHYLSELRRQRAPNGRFYQGLIFAPQETWTFFTHLMRRGVLGRCGKLPRWFGDGGPAMLFYTRGLD